MTFLAGFLCGFVASYVLALGIMTAIVVCQRRVERREQKEAAQKYTLLMDSSHPVSDAPLFTHLTDIGSIVRGRDD